LNPYQSGFQPTAEPTAFQAVGGSVPPESRPFADPDKLLDHGPFDWQKYTPITVETDGRSLWVMDGMTRIENARRAGITRLPAHVFTRR
jgi:hypothetical protein